ncbi:MAG TPA: hypothetical protein VGX76_08105, partial [Pirellulales bacterium]|nr:hypothetical protein [Pirellulales bacterium]
MSQPLAKLAVFLTPKRAWSQFRLRTLLALVALAALPCGWLKWTMVQKENELATAAEIKNRGDRVEYNWQVARKSSA